MATLLELGMILKVRINTYTGATTPTQEGQNIRYARVAGLGGAGTTDYQAALDIDLALNAAYKALMSENARYYGVGVTVIHPVQLIEQFSGQNEGNGDVAGAILPTQTCGIITLQTGFAGRANRGRVYVPFPPSAMNNNGFRPTPDYMLALNDLGPLLVNTIVVGGDTNFASLTWCLYNKTTHATKDLTEFRANRAWATQRRRGAYGQPNVPH